jgi:hypothetical protein
MQFFLYSLALLAVAGFSMLLNAFASAPEGFEDSHGFHSQDGSVSHDPLPGHALLTSGDVLFFK